MSNLMLVREGCYGILFLFKTSVVQLGFENNLIGEYIKYVHYRRIGKSGQGI